MEIYTIEKDVKLPQPRAGRPGIWIAHYDNMEPGDSFIIPDEDMPKGFRSIQSSIGASSRVTGHKVATRRVDGGLRVWLLEKPES